MPNRIVERGSRAALLALLALGLGLRLANSAWGSLKLDDFHSLHHARAADLGTFFHVLRQDNHPPLSFLLVRAARALAGESPWALRLPALLAGLGTFALVWRLGERLGCARGRLLACFLLAVSTLHVELSSDVRMYALLALASAGLLEGLVATCEAPRRAWRIALWTSVGLHAHYHFLYSLAALGAAALAWMLRNSARAALRASGAAFAVALLFAAPWYVWGFRAQLAHGLAPGGSNATPLRLVEGFKNLVFLNVSVDGAVLRWLGLLASAVMLALLALALVRWLARARLVGEGAFPSLLGAAVFLVPALTFASAQLSTRAGFEWRYLAGALPGACLLLGAEACAQGRFARARRTAVGGVALVALAVSLPNARDPGEEDYAGAVAWLVAEARSEDAVLAADWQPALFPHGIGWQYYAPRLARGPLPERLEHTPDFSLADPDAAARHERVFCCLRSLPANCALLRSLRALFPHEEKRVFGRSVFVHVFTR